MDLNELLRRHQLAMMAADQSAEGADRRVYLAIAGLYAGKIEVQRRGIGLRDYSWPIDRSEGPVAGTAPPSEGGT